MPVSAPKELVDIATIINAPDHQLRAVVNTLCIRDLELRGRVAKVLGVVAKREEIVLAKLRHYDAKNNQPPPARTPVARILFPASSSSKSDRKPIIPPRSKAQRKRKSEGAVPAAESKPLKRIKEEVKPVVKPVVKPEVKPEVQDFPRQCAVCNIIYFESQNSGAACSWHRGEIPYLLGFEAPKLSSMPEEEEVETTGLCCALYKMREGLVHEGEGCLEECRQALLLAQRYVVFAR